MINKPDWEETKNDYKLWWANKQKKPLFAIPVFKEELPSLYWSWAEWLERTKAGEKPSLTELIKQHEYQLSKGVYKGAAFPNTFLNTGPGAIASYLSGYSKFNGDTVWFELHEPMGWDKLLKLKKDPDNICWKLTKSMAKEIIKASKDKFVFGNADLGGNLDMLASLRGAQTLLYDIVDEPENVKKAVHLLTDLWFEYFDELYTDYQVTTGNSLTWMGIWAPGKSYSLQCDFGAMLSPEMFEKFALPDIKRQAKWLDQALFHLDGPGMIPHLDMLLEVDEITAIQWVPGTGKPPCTDECWVPLYKKIQDKGKGVVFSYVEPEKLKSIFKKISPANVLAYIPVETETEADEFLNYAQSFV